MKKDEELIERIRTGDLKAFEELVKKYQKRAIGFAVSILGDYQQAEDISQEAFIRVLKSLDRYREYGRFKAYFFLIVKNLCLNLIDKQERVTELDSEEEFYSLPFLEEPGANIEREEISSRLHRALGELREKERIALFLREYEKLKYREIAQILGLGLSDVKVTVHRALKKLKDNLERSVT